MNSEHEQQTSQQTHFQFQMWDRYLNALNTSWDLESANTPEGDKLEQESPPASLPGKIRFSLKKIAVRLLHPIVMKLRNSRIVADITRLEDQRAFNCRTVQTLNGLVELTNAELERLRKEVAEHLQIFQGHLDIQQRSLDTQQHALDTQQRSLDTQQRSLDTQQRSLDTQQSSLDTLQNHLDNRLEQIEPRIDTFELMIWAFDRRKEALELEQIAFNKKLGKVLTAIKSLQQGDPLDVADLPAPERQDDYTYFVFENRHRGTEKAIKKRLEEYVRYFEGCSRVLDIGCARGEFLELLAEHNISGYGIDQNHSEIHYCQQKGLNVQEADALAHLRSLDNGSLDGIVMAHIAEHFPPPVLQQLLTLCFQKLQAHAYLIVETPNPCSVYALSQYFYKDLSHNKPLHPDALLYLIQLAGFEQAEVVPKNHFSGKDALKELTCQHDVEEPLRSLIDVVNQDVRQLNDFLYGHLDYAIVARKSPVV